MDNQQPSSYIREGSTTIESIGINTEEASRVAYIIIGEMGSIVI